MIAQKVIIATKNVLVPRVGILNTCDFKVNQNSLDQHVSPLLVNHIYLSVY